MNDRTCITCNACEPSAKVEGAGLCRRDPQPVLIGKIATHWCRAYELKKAAAKAAAKARPGA